MITGKDAFPEKELKRLVDHLCQDEKPDIIHLSNALIIGLARQLKNVLDVKIVCSLLNEDDWINEMAEPFQSDAWKLIGEGSPYVDAFLTPSVYFRDLFMSKTGYKGNHFNVVPLGLDPAGLTDIEKSDNWPCIGYFCRINAHNGFDKLIDSFIELKSRNTLPGLTLKVSGGYTSDDKPFINRQMKKIARAGLADSVKIYAEFAGLSKREFFSTIDVMCVPVRKYDGYGLYLLEANCAGVPVVQPSTGAFPEIVEKTGGGIIYSPDDTKGLADALENILKDRELLSRLGKQGKENVLKNLSLQKMSEGLSEVYKSVLS
jgi:glycosyltransferase involved in cell wall biosynthesis